MECIELQAVGSLLDVKDCSEKLLRQYDLVLYGIAFFLAGVAIL